jgi:membrane-associated phospholipid phosphatase
MLQDIISMSTVLLYGLTAVLYIYTQHTVHLIGFIGLLGTVFLSEFIKYYIVGSSNPRPTGAKNCNLWCDDGNQAGRPGMPSSHAATVAFFGCFYYPHTDNLWIKNGLILYAGLVMVSRYIKQCHTVEQLTVGYIFGTIMALIGNAVLGYVS